jgi:hypothetical protein
VEARLGRRDDGDLRHGEDPVRHEQHDDEENLEDYGTHNFSPEAGPGSSQTYHCPLVP